MKTFLAIYTGSPESMDAWRALAPPEREERERAGVQAWMQWVTAHADAIVDQGAPLGKTRRVSAQGTTDIRNAMAAYTLVRAESHEAAARLFEGHPHFTIFPGEAVEVMECMPLPQQ